MAMAQGFITSLLVLFTIACGKRVDMKQTMNLLANDTEAGDVFAMHCTNYVDTHCIAECEQPSPCAKHSDACTRIGLFVNPDPDTQESNGPCDEVDTRRRGRHCTDGKDYHCISECDDCEDPCQVLGFTVSEEQAPAGSPSCFEQLEQEKAPVASNASSGICCFRWEHAEGRPMAPPFSYCKYSHGKCKQFTAGSGTTAYLGVPTSLCTNAGACR